MFDQTYLAIDLGAGSGRVMAGRFDGARLRLEEVHRFPNTGLVLSGRSHWNIPLLFAEIKNGLREAARRYGSSIVSVAVDAWGVDYGLLDRNGRLLGLPYMYRDSRTDGMIEEAEALIPPDEMYKRTGIHPMSFNTIFQLMAERRDCGESFNSARRLLFIPDLLTYWLSGEIITDRTIASTSQLVTAGTAEWDRELATKMGIPHGLLQPMTEPATTIGHLLPQIAEEIGCGRIKIVNCGSHDTACAVAGVPSETLQPLFLSSGTWSLFGREISDPLISEGSRRAGFSNEQGIGQRIRFLKTVPGMWLVQECMRTWDVQNGSAAHMDLIDQAKSAKSSVIIDPGAREFQKSCDMPEAIRSFAEKTGQRIPRSRGEMFRAIFESLASQYRNAVEQLREWMPDLPDSIHVVGGGSQNDLLNQLTADATGLRVLAGPVEATATGNIISQLIAAGKIDSLDDGRDISRQSFVVSEFTPGGSNS